MGSMSIFHWLLVLLVFFLFFGTEKVARMGKDLGTAIRHFKEGLHESGKPDSVDRDDRS